MLNIVYAELMKTKKSKIFTISTLIALVVPVFLIIHGAILEPLTAQYTHYTDWFMTGLMFSGTVLPIMSGFVISILIQREYQDHTVINVLTAPVSRISFIVSKLMIWFLWYAVTLFAIIAIFVLGYYLVYTETFYFNGVKLLVELFTKFGLLSFVASFPLLWIAIKQRKVFYPSILLALFFTAIQIAAFQTSAGLLPLASIVPWSAVAIVSMSAPMPYSAICIASIVVTGLLGLLLSCYTFNKQDQ